CAACALWAGPSYAAGQFFFTDSSQYWLFVHESPAFELKVPADRQSYVQRRLFGEESLEVTWGASGPVLIVGGRTGYTGDAAAVRDALAARFRYGAPGLRVVTDETITTAEGLSADFFVLELPQSQGGMMLRIVVFQRRTDLAFLAFAVQSDAYNGDTRSYWLEAVNTFRWR
ncbi:MAG TPA: hypothetical protein VF234_08610, partial [Limnochordia bacterium]